MNIYWIVHHPPAKMSKQNIYENIQQFCMSSTYQFLSQPADNVWPLFLNRLTCKQSTAAPQSHLQAACGQWAPGIRYTRDGWLWESSKIKRYHSTLQLRKLWPSCWMMISFYLCRHYESHVCSGCSKINMDETLISNMADNIVQMLPYLTFKLY